MQHVASLARIDFTADYLVVEKKYLKVVNELILFI